SIVPQLRRSLRAGHHRLRRAEARHPAEPTAYARRDLRDEAAECEGRPGRALLRSEDAELDRARDRCAGAGHAAVGGRREGDRRLRVAVRLRHHAARQRAEEGWRDSVTDTEEVYGHAR